MRLFRTGLLAATALALSVSAVAAPRHPFPAMPVSGGWQKDAPAMALSNGSDRQPSLLRLAWDSDGMAVHVTQAPVSGKLVLRVAAADWSLAWKGSEGSTTVKKLTTPFPVSGSGANRSFTNRITWAGAGLPAPKARQLVFVNVTWSRPDGTTVTYPARGRGVIFLNDNVPAAECAMAVGAPLRYRFEPRGGRPRMVIEPDPDSNYCGPAEVTIHAIGERSSVDREVKTICTDGPVTVEAPAIPGAKAVSLIVAPVLEGQSQPAAEYRALPAGQDVERFKGDQTWQPPSDWDAFWARAKADLAKVPMNPRITEVKEKATATGRLYRVELDSIGGVTIVCWYFVPKDVDVLGGKSTRTYPAVQRMPGYASNQGEQDSTGLGWISLAVNPRGHGASAAFWPLPDNHLEYNIGDAETYYYRSAYMDCLRAMQFLRSRPEVDQKRIGTEGSSQGGAFSLATAALDGQTAACVAYVPFLSSFPDAVRLATGGGFTTMRDRFEAPDTPEGAALRRSVSYIDARFMAARIKCPTQITINLMDRICPPPTGFADYNSIPAGVPKEVAINPTLDHELTEGMVKAGQDFLRKWLK